MDKVHGYYISKLTGDKYTLVGGGVVALDRVVVHLQYLDGDFGLIPRADDVFPSVRHLSDNFEFVDEPAY